MKSWEESNTLIKYRESEAPSEDQQRDEIDMFVREWVDDIVKPYVYDHDAEGLAVELAHVTDRLVNWDSDTVIEELGYEPDWDLFEEVSNSVVEDTVGDLTYKEGFEDLNDLFCEESN